MQSDLLDRCRRMVGDAIMLSESKMDEKLTEQDSTMQKRIQSALRKDIDAKLQNV